MNRPRSGTVVTWRTRNARKTKKMESWCADFGLAPIYKRLRVGSLYENERRSLERKFKSMLTGKQDQYCIIVLCASCFKSFGAAYEIGEIETPYEIV